MPVSNGTNEGSLSLFPRLSALCSKAFLAIATVAVLSAAAPAQAAPSNDDDPYEDVTAAANPSAGSDLAFQDLFNNWKKMDGFAVNGGAVVQNPQVASGSIPSIRPVEHLTLTSNYGVRTDPFNGRQRNHKGIDIPGPIGTPIYATADGIVSRSQWVNGYGNLVEIGHGNNIETRYGHLSKLLVQPNQRVRRGQLIALMGSTGRSTGSHLHYEVRVAGEAVNPLPFVQGSDYLIALNSKPPVAMGGPEKDIRDVRD